MRIIQPIKSLIKEVAPRRVIEAAKRYVEFGFEDFWDGIRGTRPELVPPKSIVFVGERDFVEVGEEFFRYFKEFGGILPSHRVLDIACGLGRMARPLAGYLDSRGEYQGFDIVESAIRWCKRNYGSGYPNFHFQVANIYNKAYHPKGKLKPSEFEFPYKDGYFDFVFATSLFTHMLPDDARHYLTETSRVLKPGGKCLITFFIWNQESESMTDSGRSPRKFIPHDGFWIQNRDVPEDAVAMSEEFVLTAFQSAGLKVEEPIRFGNWCGREVFTSYQDILVARKEN